MSRADFIARRAAGKRAALLAAAAEVFAAEGFDGAATERIAALAQVSTATLYRLFSSKTELFAATMQESLTAFETTLETTQGECPQARLTAVATAYAALLCAPRTAGLLRALLQAAPTTPALAEAFYERIKTRLAGAMHAAANEAGLPAITAPGALIMGMIEHQTAWRALLTGAGPDVAPETIAAEAVAAALRAYGPAGSR